MEDGPTAVPKDTEVTAEARTEEAAMAALTEEAATAVRLKAAVTVILQREEAAMAILTEEVTAARTEGAATDTRLKVAVMVILQREEAATAHPREVSARQAEVSLHQAEGHSALETAVTTAQEEADSTKAQNSAAEEMLHAPRQEAMPREARPNLIRTNSMTLTRRASI